MRRWLGHVPTRRAVKAAYAWDGFEIIEIANRGSPRLYSQLKE